MLPRLSKNMKKTNYIGYLILLIFTVISCKSEQEKIIQAEFNKIEGDWSSNSFMVTGSDASTLQPFLSRSRMVFVTCKYTDKAFNNHGACGADLEVNSVLYRITYIYDINTKKYSWTVSTYSNGKDFAQNTVATMLTGKWSLDVNGNTMTCIQENNATYNVKIQFTATRK
jgi:hypothetical protein